MSEPKIVLPSDFELDQLKRQLIKARNERVDLERHLAELEALPLNEASRAEIEGVRRRLQKPPNLDEIERRLSALQRCRNQSAIVRLAIKLGFPVEQYWDSEKARAYLAARNVKLPKD
jgi:hypothetical protein